MMQVDHFQPTIEVSELKKPKRKPITAEISKAMNEKYKQMNKAKKDCGCGKQVKRK